MKTMPLPLKVRSKSGKKASSVSFLFPIVKPPLKWAGGKRWLVPHLQTLWQKHSHRRLVEPFSGGLAVTLGLIPRKALLNDVNVHLVNFYTYLKKGLRVNLDFKNDTETYYQFRAKFNALLSAGKEHTEEAAQIFYYLNRTGFNGLCRFNQSGKFNVPVGRYKTISYKTDFLEYKEAFKNWEFAAVDFENLKLAPTDFIYADPPYDVQFTQYSAGGFNWEDQVRTAEWLTKHTGPVVLSNQATPRIMSLYRSLGFNTHILDAPRMISSTGNRDKAKEVLATRNVI
jgi:DNA adenine methylase